VRSGERQLTDEKVDVVMLTKNSERLLSECLASVYKNIPVNNLIVVDGYSTDATLKILEQFQKKYGNVVLIQDGGTRGRARQKAIGRVETGWFMFVDSDVILSDGWFEKAKELMKDDVGAIWGMEIWSAVKDMKVLGLFERVNMKIFQNRGGTHDLLVRRKAIEDINIPAHLHTYEDAYIRSWIRKKGYNVIAVYEPYCIHYRPETVWTLRGSISFIVSDLKFAVRYPQLPLAYAVFSVIVLHQGLSRNIITKS
jgi:glycosyltransferase involved in cell wall biosynthesis